MAAKPMPDPDFEERVRASFARQQAMRTIGAELTLVAPGSLPNDGKVIADERPVT